MPATTLTTTSPPSESVVSELRIAVQNATDDQYASSSMADHLRSLGFYNVYVMRDWSHVAPDNLSGRPAR